MGLFNAGWVVTVQSAPNQPHQLLLSHVASSEPSKQWTWHAIEITSLSSLPPEVAQHLQQLQFETIKACPAACFAAAGMHSKATSKQRTSPCGCPDHTANTCLLP